MADFNRNETAGQIVRRALGMIALPRPVSVSESTDKTSQQFWTLLTECGQELLSEYNWQVLKKTHEIVTTTETEYALPDDWERYIDSTGWNNTGRLPMLGPMTDPQWRMLQARQMGGTTIRVQYIIRDGRVVLYFAPTPAQTLNIDYISRGWVQDATDPTVFRDHVESDADIVLYRPRLIISMLKYWWRKAKGFESADDREEYEKALEHAKYNDAPKSDWATSARSGFPYLGYVNMPDTNYGGS